MYRNQLYASWCWRGDVLLQRAPTVITYFHRPSPKSTVTDFRARGVFACNTRGFIGILIGSNHTTECHTAATQTKYITVKDCTSEPRSSESWDCLGFLHRVFILFVFVSREQKRWCLDVNLVNMFLSNWILDYQCIDRHIWNYIIICSNFLCHTIWHIYGLFRHTYSTCINSEIWNVLLWYCSSINFLKILF